MKTNVEGMRNLEENFRIPFHFQLLKEILGLCMAFRAQDNFGVRVFLYDYRISHRALVLSINN